MRANALRGTPPAVTPDDLVSELLAPEDGVQQRLEVVARGGVAMQVQAAVRSQHTLHLDKPDGHVAQERPEVVAPCHACCVDDLPHGGPVVLHLVDPLAFDVVSPRPAVLELRARSERVRRGVEVAALVERRVGRDQVDCLGVHASQHGEVVAVEQRPVRPVRFGHHHGSDTVPAGPAATRSQYRTRCPMRPRTVARIWSMVSISRKLCLPAYSLT